MLQPLQLQEVATRYSKEIAEVQDFLLKAGFTPGKASSLGTVTDRLRQDRTMRRDLTSHVWVVLHTSKASYAELLALVTLAAAGPQFAADADEDEAHDLLRFLMGARGEFEGAPVLTKATTPVAWAPEPVIPPPTPLAPAPVPFVTAPVAPVVVAPISAGVPVVSAAPVVVPAAAPVVAAPVVEAPIPPVPVLTGQPTPPASTARARFTDSTIAGNLPPMRKQGDLPPMRWGGSSEDTYYDSSPEPEGRMATVAVIVCLLAVLLFGGAIWRYQYVQKRQAEVNQQQQQQLQQQQQQDDKQPTPSAPDPNAAK